MPGYEKMVQFSKTINQSLSKFNDLKINE